MHIRKIENNLMKCVFVNDVKFSQSSINAIKDIRRRTQLSNPLTAALPAGVMINIFLGNKPLQSVHNISQTDFESLSKAMAAVPSIQRKLIHDIDVMQALEHSGKEAQFWKGVANGCGIK